MGGSVFEVAEIDPKRRPLQNRQIGVRFSEPDLARLDEAARRWKMGRSTLVQRLIVEWLDSLDKDGENA